MTTLPPKRVLRNVWALASTDLSGRTKPEMISAVHARKDASGSAVGVGNSRRHAGEHRMVAKVVRHKAVPRNFVPELVLVRQSPLDRGAKVLGEGARRE